MDVQQNLQNRKKSLELVIKRKKLKTTGIFPTWCRFFRENCGLKYVLSTKLPNCMTADHIDRQRGTTYSIKIADKV